MDENACAAPCATARALARYLDRGVSCGAVGEETLRGATGLDRAVLSRLALPKSDTESLRVPARPLEEEPREP